jgi:hypothetical protein
MAFMRASAIRLAALLAAAGLVATAMSTRAPAGPLDEQTCEQLKREVADLESLGARTTLAKGAAWGKANLDSRQLEVIRKLIEIDEAIAFRCPRPKPVPDVAAAAAPKAKRPPKGAPKVKPEQRKTKPGEVAKAAAAKGQPKAATPAGDGRVGAAPPPAKPRPKPAQPKAQDAYVPPAKATQTPQ